MDSAKYLLNICCLVTSAFCASIFVSLDSVAEAGAPRDLLDRTWFSSSQDLLTSYGAQPAECLRPASPTRRDQQTLGRIAFHSPRLLGGQAARMRLSCASCHINGRSNAHFFIQQISESPGTADISHAFLSSTGGDSIFNPKRIPDLAYVSNRKIADREAAEFAVNLRRLIEVEFDGQSTPDTIFSALTVYLEDLDNKHCGSGNRVKHKSLASDWRLLDDAVEQLRQRGSHADPAIRNFLIGSARAVLEVVYHNFATNPHRQIDQALIELSRSLSELAQVPHGETNQRAYQAALARWQHRAKQTYARLNHHLSESAYDQQALQRHLDQIPHQP